MPDLPGRVAARSASVRQELATTYNRARLVLSSTGAIVTLVVGTVHGWARGPWVLCGSVLLTLHALYVRSGRSRSATSLLLTDLLVMGLVAGVIGIPTVTLMTLSFVMISAAMLESGRRVYVLWLADVVVIGAAGWVSTILDMAEYTPSQRAVSEGVSLSFVAGASVALTYVLSKALARTETGQRAAERQLSAADRRHRAVSALSSDGVVVTDAGLKILEQGVQNEALTSYAVSEHTGRSILDLVVPEDRSTVLEAFHRVVKDPDTAASFTMRLRRRDGELRSMSAVARNLLSDPDLEGFVFNFRDVTEVERARERLTSLMRSKDEFVAAVSHELRGPLRTVLGLAGLLETEKLDVGEQQELLNVLVSQASHGAAIVEDLLVAARADVGEIGVRLQGCSVHQAVADVVAAVGPSTDIDLHVDPSLLVVADPVRLHQIVRNVVVNARRHGGNDISVHARVAGEDVLIAVEDDGPGVPDDSADFIFEPYGRAGSAKAEPTSIGLGLSVARTLARAMSGDVVYRRTGGRTVFEISLPMSRRTSPVGEERSVA